MEEVHNQAQCAVGRQTAVIKRMVEAAEIITFACDRSSRPSRPYVAPTLRPKRYFGEGCWSSGSTPVSREGPAIWESTRVVVQDVRWECEETPVRGRQMQQKARCHPTSHQESFQSPQHQHLAMRQLWCCGNGHCAIHHARHQIARCGCRLSEVWWMCHFQHCHRFAL